MLNRLKIETVFLLLDLLSGLARTVLANEVTPVLGHYERFDKML